MKDTALAALYFEELYRFSTPLVVVLPRAWNSYSSGDQSLLKKILTSVKVNINAVLVIERASLDPKDLAVYAPARALLFGCTMESDVPLYQQTAAYGFTMIKADDLNALDEQRKKNLWNALRQMFGV